MRKLDAREYKLLLNPACIQQEPNLDVANAFWNKNIKQIVWRVDLGATPFMKAAYRNIRFWDTAACDLTKHSLILRTREEANTQFISNGDPEATLKLRMPDQFTVGATSFTDATNAETEFEEDIGPLEFVASLPGTGDQIVTPKKPSTRNRFSLSATVPLSSSEPMRDIDDVYELFPGARRIVAVPEGSELVGGPMIHEYTFKKSTVRIDGTGAEAKFTLSVWCFDSPWSPPDVVEVSFVYKTDENGQISGQASQHAYNLFIDLQTSLADLVDTNNASKTALSLPSNCRGR